MTRPLDCVRGLIPDPDPGSPMGGGRPMTDAEPYVPAVQAAAAALHRARMKGGRARARITAEQWRDATVAVDAACGHHDHPNALVHPQFPHRGLCLCGEAMYNTPPGGAA